MKSSTVAYKGVAYQKNLVYLWQKLFELVIEIIFTLKLQCGFAEAKLFGNRLDFYDFTENTELQRGFCLEVYLICRNNSFIQKYNWGRKSENPIKFREVNFMQKISRNMIVVNN